ncbi:hypothetical protein ABPG77_003044 [Micractinium sp. CCAP 211/92]
MAGNSPLQRFMRADWAALGGFGNVVIGFTFVGGLFWQGGALHAQISHTAEQVQRSQDDAERRLESNMKETVERLVSDQEAAEHRQRTALQEAERRWERLHQASDLRWTHALAALCGPLTARKIMKPGGEPAGDKE